MVMVATSATFFNWKNTPVWDFVWDFCFLPSQNGYKGKKKSPQKRSVFKDFFDGAPRGIRTHDLLIRSQTLYPAELGAHLLFFRTAYIL